MSLKRSQVFGLLFRELSRTGASIFKLSRIHLSMLEGGQSLCLRFTRYAYVVTSAPALQIVPSGGKKLSFLLKFFHSAVHRVNVIFSRRNALFCLSYGATAFLNIRLNILIAVSTPPISVWKPFLNVRMAFMMSVLEGFSMFSVLSMFPAPVRPAALSSSKSDPGTFSSLKSPSVPLLLSLVIFLGIFVCTTYMLTRYDTFT